jgi:two-component system chemotaxis response regulator CheY
MFATTAKILVVDDMKTMRRLVGKLLGDQGYKNTVEAEDGEKAWTMIQEAHKAGQPFDIIVSDWNMPKMKGIDLLRKVRSDARTKNLAFLMVTAEVEATSLQEATAPDARVSGFLNKPFRPEELKAQLALAYTASTGKKAA